MAVGCLYLLAAAPERLPTLARALERQGWCLAQAASLAQAAAALARQGPSLVLADLGPRCDPADLTRAQSWAREHDLPLVCRGPAPALGRLLEAMPVGQPPRLVPEHWPAEDLGRALAEVLTATVAGQAEGGSLHRTIVTNLRTGILVVQDEIVRFANPWVFQYLGLSASQVLGQSLIPFIDPQHQDLARESHRLRLAGEPAPESYRVRVMNAQGRSSWMQINAMPFSWGGRPASLVFLHDISEEVQVQRELREKEEHLRALVENIPGMVYRCEVESPWRVTHISGGALALTGYTPDQFRRGEIDFGRLILADDLEPVQREVARAVADRQHYLIEYRIRHADGSLRWVFEKGRASYDSQGAPQFLDGVILDITDRKWAEEARRVSEEKFRKAFKASPVWVSVTSLEDGRFLEVNDAFTQITGYDYEEALGKTSFDLGFWLDPEKDRQTALDLFRRQGGFRNLETRMRFKDGRVHTMLWSVDQIDYEGRPCFLNVLTDVSELKEAEEALKASEEKHRLLVESVGAVVWRGDPQTLAFTYVSQQAETLLGHPLESWTADPDFWVSHLHPDDRAWAPKHRAEALSWGKEHQIEYRMLAADGREVWLRDIVKPILDQGRVREVVGVMIDVSDRHRAAAEKEALERQLRHAQKMEAVGTLAGGIAHDFNNILAGITGYAELALESASQGRDNSDDLRQILRSAQRAGFLVRQVLAFSRRVETNLRPVDLNQELLQVAALLERTIPKMIALTVTPARNPALVNADPGQIQQILVNLAANAQDAMPEGGRLDITVRTQVLERDLIQDQARIPAGAYVVVTVADTGRGISEADLPHIFEPFFTTKGVGQGSGLGLSTVFGLVKGHGGHIICHSREGQGASFAIYLPSLGPVESVAPAEPAAPAPSTARETILVVDDEPALLTVARRTLESQGYRVLTASSGEEALETYRDHPGRIDLVLMDLGMPGMGGARCLLLLKELDPGARVIISSGYAPDACAGPEVRQAALGFLAKPYRRNDLLQMVRQTLEAARKPAPA
ncbi:MAG: PAS domain S-box protein [Desulfarculus sp.]|nr:PAS domain S-box protein [Desulfarculus sp.]